MIARKLRLQFLVVVLMAVAGMAGCEPASREPVPVGGGTPAPAPQATAPEPAPAPAPVEPAAPPATVQKPADVGVGKRGRNYGQGLVATPAAAYFAAQEQVAFRIEVPRAMDLFKATNSRAPNSHEEFMKEIVQANQIKLPELPAGHKYVYDPAQEQLLVEQPE